MKGVRTVPAVRQRAKQLRRGMTDAEVRLWRGLRGWKLGHWRRQHPLGRFILDFYLHPARLCIEVDGCAHESPDQQEIDRLRTEALERLGIRVIRFTNAEVLHDTRRVLRMVRARIRLRLAENRRQDPLSGRRIPSALPCAGEGWRA